MSKVFLSHNKADKPFVRKLKEGLEDHGIQVWMDEFEINVGDSLIDKISDGIENCEFLGVVLSPNSVASEWVKKEVNIALTQEIQGKKVKVLPILHRECKLPLFLIDKFYADFTVSFEAGLVQLLRTLGRDVSSLIEKAPSSEPFVKEFSESDWIPREVFNGGRKETSYSLTVEYSVHKKKSPSVLTQIKSEDGWQECKGSVHTVNEHDVRIIFLRPRRVRITIK